MAAFAAAPDGAAHATATGNGNSSTPPAAASASALVGTPGRAVSPPAEWHEIMSRIPRPAAKAPDAETKRAGYRSLAGEGKPR